MAPRTPNLTCSVQRYSDTALTLPREPSQLPTKQETDETALHHHRIPLVLVSPASECTTARPSSPLRRLGGNLKLLHSLFFPRSLATHDVPLRSAPAPPGLPLGHDAARVPVQPERHAQAAARERRAAAAPQGAAQAPLQARVGGRAALLEPRFGAAVASTAFHRSKETKYLLVDASISSTLAIVFVYFAMHVLKNEWYGILAIKLTQGFMCVFTWLYCGLPGGERYELWHQRWHYVSGFTTITTTLLLAMYMPDFDIIMHELIQDYMIVTKWLQ